MAQPVNYDVERGVAVLGVNNPPVNALSAAVRKNLAEGLQRALSDPEVAAVLIIGEGRSFPAGADIAEFGKPAKDPGLPDLCNSLEGSPKPVIAALHGTALGGGFEVALGAHYRVAHKSAQFGLPEVTLGILPGAGGTQRTPRLAGAELALDLMLSGKPMRADSPEADVFFDAIIDGDLREGALQFACDLVAQGAGPRRTCEAHKGFVDPVAYQRAVARRRKDTANGPETAPQEILDCVEAAELLPFDQGLAFERAAFETCVTSDQSAALRHAFFAERKAAKFPELVAGKARDVQVVGIIGGGTTGSGIAIACLSAGLDVIVVERDAAALANGLARIDAMLERGVSRGHLSVMMRDQQRMRLQGASDLVAVSGADLVIEAVTEDMHIKLGVFAQLDGVAKEGAILATNTSYLDVDRIARETGSPGDVLGLHFFSPAHVMRLIEVVVGAETTDDAVATAVALAKRLGKVPVRSGVCDGFIGNRILSTYCMAADMMLEEGATPNIIDTAMESFGMAMGPYKVMDLAGLDTSWARRRRLAPTRNRQERYVAIGDILCEAGRFGQKAGKGYYLYEEGSREASQDSEVIAIIRAERERKGLTARGFKPEEIQRRCLAAMANEGARLLREGIATRPSDIDTVMIHGYGFPRWRGGPMMAADITGLLRIKRDLEGFAREDAGFWAPEPVFDELIKNGRGFASLND